jgi:hypothetical protein
MPSPFPGMNPYLEQPDVWHDFHQRFVPRIAEALSAQIRPGYIAKVDDHVYIHELSGDERLLLGRPDVSISRSGYSVAMASDVHALAAPAFGHVPLGIDAVHEPFIEIRDRETREVITVIELLSPTNKASGSDREQYVGKRKAILASNTHLVEIDLLRGGERMPIQDLPASDYVIMVSRSYERPRVELWPTMLREPLPVIPVPLRVGDADATVDLGRLLHEQYDAAGYEDYIYRTNPQPAVPAPDADWVGSIAGARPIH